MLRGNVLAVVTLLIAGLFYIGSHSLASPSLAVVINEVAWMGTTSSANAEWIELVNTTSDPIDLTGWTLAAADGSPSITLTGTISSGGYFLLERTDDTTVPDVAADQIFTGALSNTGEALELRDNSGVLIDEIMALSGWFAGNNVTKHTMARITATTESGMGNWIDSNEVGGTPKADNAIVITPSNVAPVADPGVDQNGSINEDIIFDGTASSDSDGTIVNYIWNFGDGASANGVTTTHAFSIPATYLVSLTVTDNSGSSATATTTTIISSNYATTSSQILINELVSDPVSGNDEWVELYNAGTTTVDISGWSIVEGNGSVTNLSGMLNGGEFKLIEGITGSLNNDGDIVILKNHAGGIVDSATYGSWNDGNVSDNALMTADPQSLARAIDGVDTNNDLADFKVTMTPTPAATNNITAPVITTTGGSSSRTTNSPVAKNTLSFNASDVVINELVSDPVDGGDEWIELYNTTNHDIELKDWSLIDGSNAATVFSEDTIKSLNYFIIEKPKGNLNNAGDHLQLKDPSTKVIDVLSYGNWNDGNIFDNAPVASDPYALARDNKSTDTNNDAGDFHITSSVTKGKQNSITSKDDAATSTPDVLQKQSLDLRIEFSELLPNPDGIDAENEFIELYNPNEAPVYLKGWRIRDESGKVFVCTDQYIKPKDFLLIEAETSKITLNNSSDELRLLSPGGTEIDLVAYEDASEGLSYARFTRGWQWTAQPTPDKVNILSSSVANKIANIKIPTRIELEDIREVELGALVTTQGVVVAEPGVLGSQYFYLAGSGAQVYSYKKDFPKLVLGDRIAVTGVVSEASGERRIKISKRADIITISTSTQPITPVKMPIAEIDDSHIGSLIKISGILVEHKGSSLVLADDSGEIQVYIKSTTGIKTSDINEGDTLEINGILSVTKNGFRVLPRYQSDILKIAGEVKGEMVAQKENQNNWWQSQYAIAVSIFVLALAGFFIGKRLHAKYSTHS